jgi:hypothetical protein
VLVSKRDALYAELGKAAYERHGINAGDPRVVTPIANAQAQLSALDEEIEDLSNSYSGSWYTPTRLANLFYVLMASLVIAPCLVCGGCLTVYNYRQREAVKKEVAEANQLWDSGDKVQAVGKYKVLIEKQLWRIEDSAKSICFQRAIEFEAEKGDSNSARQLIEKALDEKVSLTLNNPKAKQIMAEVRTEKEAKAVREDETAGKRKLQALKDIVSKLESFPDRFAPVAERRQYNKELEKLVKGFDSIKIDVKVHRKEATAIVELYEKKIERRYDGQIYGELSDMVREIARQLVSS